MVPLIALTTGARLGEVGQLRTVDVKAEGGMRYFDITDQGDGNTIKTVSSRRRVPIHPDLVRLGFFEYVDRLKAAGVERLFAGLKPDAQGVLTGNWSKWIGRYLRSSAVGITDKRKTFHSLRHTFKDICRQAGIAKEVSDAITGHTAGDNEGSNYGADHYPLSPLVQAMKRLQFSDVLKLVLAR
jgi:integrase